MYVVSIESQWILKFIKVIDFLHKREDLHQTYLVDTDRKNLAKTIPLSTHKIRFL